jgi:pimeloyl-ACP methyl ester carboxylesterase
LSAASVLAHRVTGSGPPLLLLNGGLMSIAAWEPVAEPLARDFTVVRCDLRGQLLSPGAVPASLEGQAAEVLALLDHLGLSRVHVVGTSYGGFVGQVLALAHPERVASLTLIATAARTTAGDPAATAALRRAIVEAAAGGDGGRVLDELAPYTFSPAFLARDPSLYASRRAAVASLPSSWFAALVSLLDALDGLDLRSRLPAVRCPAQVVAAELDLTFPVALSRELCAAVPSARLSVVAGAGHAVVVEDPARCVEEIRGFVGYITRLTPTSRV